MISKRHLLLGGAGLLATAGGVWLSQQRQKSTHALWDLTLNTPTGTTLPLGTFQGKPLLINFWATWCPPCIAELPLLNQFYLAQQKHAQPKNKSFQLLGIAADKASSVVQFLTKHPIEFPTVLAGFEGIALSKQLGNASGSLPFSVWIDAKGDVLFTKQGQLTDIELNNLASRHLSV